MRLPKIMRRSDLEEARKATDASLQRADRDLAKAKADLRESRQLEVRIREHNTANHFDDWLESVFYQRREAR
jgi:uncharacterized protein YegJ (DUF2314 family)